jgi:hypothetical protein
MSSLLNVSRHLTLSQTGVQEFRKLLADEVALKKECKRAPKEMLSLLNIIKSIDSDVYRLAIKTPAFLPALAEAGPTSRTKVAMIITGLMTPEDRQDALKLKNEQGDPLVYFLTEYGLGVHMSELLFSLSPSQAQEMLALKNAEGNPLAFALLEYTASEKIDKNVVDLITCLSTSDAQREMLTLSDGNNQLWSILAHRAPFELAKLIAGFPSEESQHQMLSDMGPHLFSQGGAFEIANIISAWKNEKAQCEILTELANYSFIRLETKKTVLDMVAHWSSTENQQHFLKYFGRYLVQLGSANEVIDIIKKWPEDNRFDYFLENNRLAELIKGGAGTKVVELLESFTDTYFSRYLIRANGLHTEPFARSLSDKGQGEVAQRLGDLFNRPSVGASPKEPGQQ